MVWGDQFWRSKKRGSERRRICGTGEKGSPREGREAEVQKKKFGGGDPPRNVNPEAGEKTEKGKLWGKKKIL